MYILFLLIIVVGHTRSILPLVVKRYQEKLLLWLEFSLAILTIVGPHYYVMSHCFDEIHQNKVQVQAGTNYAFHLNKGQTRNAEQLVWHENFRVGDNGVQEHNDLLLVKLSYPFNVNSHVQVIGLENVTLDRDAFMFGFGDRDDRKRKPTRYLRVRNVTFIPDEKCQEMLSNSLTKSVKESYEICAEKSPLIQIFDGVPKIVGMTSWLADDLYTCNTPPAVFLKVADFQDWLTEKLRDLETNNTITGQT